MVVAKDQRLVGLTDEPDIVANLPLQLPAVPARIADGQEGVVRAGLSTGEAFKDLPGRGQREAAGNGVAGRRDARHIAVQDEAALRLDRPSHQDRRITRGARINAELFEEARHGQVIGGPVHHQAHGVTGVVGADEDHGAVEPAVFDPWHGDQEAAGEVAGGEDRHQPQDRHLWRPNQPKSTRRAKGLAPLASPAWLPRCPGVGGAINDLPEILWTMTLKVGDHIPAATFMTFGPEGPRPITTDEIFKGKTVALFAVPGAFTPTCSAKHVPGFKTHAAEFRAKGVETIACVSVNDVFVMKAWGADQEVGDDILMLADGNGAFAAAIGLELDGKGFGMGVRSQRYSLLAKDGVVTELNVEAGGEFRVSAAEYMLAQL